MAALRGDPPPPARREPAAPSFASIPKPPQRRALLTVALLAAGLAVLLAVLAFTLWRGKGAEPPAPAGRSPAAQAPARP
jgi:hypothetical protein